MDELQTMPVPETPQNELRSINIDSSNYRFVLRVGCQNIAIESKDDLIKYLTQYIKDPSNTEKLYRNNELLKHQIK